MSECANCGEPGHPGHHWLEDAGMYVCYHRPELTEDAPPPGASKEQQ